jgi:hypothetical protein
MSRLKRSRTVLLEQNAYDLNTMTCIAPPTSSKNTYIQATSREP